MSVFGQAGVKRGAGFAALALLGCNQIQAADDRICSTPPSLTAQGSLPEDMLAGCIHRWAYRLRDAPGSTAEIADAVIGGCYQPLWNLAEHNGNGAHSAGGDQASANASAARNETRARAKLEAMFYVAQARAGHCAIPE